MRQLTLLLCLLLLVGFVSAQSDFKGELIPSGINTEYDEIMPQLAEDDQVLYFVRAQHPGNVKGRGGGQDVWMSRRGPDGEWQEAANLGSPVNNGLHNFVGGVSRSGDALFLGNAYEEMMPGISVTQRSGREWTSPQTMVLMEPSEDQMRAAGFLSFYLTPDENTLIYSITNGMQREDLYVRTRENRGVWSEARSLGDIINTDGAETAPFLSRDGNQLYFTSTGLSGHMGGGDIYVSQRLDDTWINWSEPKHLGRAVNTPGFDGYFILDQREETAYFVSGPDPRSLGDIYTIPVSLIEALEDEDRVDTLYIDLAYNETESLSFVRYGVPNDAATLVTTRSLDGMGNIRISRSAPYFTYIPAPGFQGKETLEMMYCDPPQSDECLKVIVVADVAPAPASVRPKPVLLSLRTPQGTPARLPLPQTVQDRIDLKRTIGLNVDGDGYLKWNNETENEYLRYTPAPNFVGVDTIDIVGVSEDLNPKNCIVAKVAVDVYSTGPMVIDDDPFLSDDLPDPDPVVETPVDTPVVEEPATVRLFGRLSEDGTDKAVNSEIELYEEEGNKLVGTLQPDELGQFEIRLPGGKDYLLQVNSTFHYPLTAAVPGDQEEVERNLSLFPLPVEKGQTYVLNNILFDVNKATLRPESTDELRGLFAFLRANPDVEILVMGHTDNQNTEVYNQKLSEDRVASVIRYLKYRGIMGYRLQGEGFGESRPIDTNDTAAGRANNRRVEFKILKD